MLDDNFKVYLIEVNDVLEVLDSFWSEEPASSERGATPSRGLSSASVSCHFMAFQSLFTRHSAD